ncbi:MAG: non-canonical purine NTP pyrophosphatase [Pseudomonadota bacterium]
MARRFQGDTLVLASNNAGKLREIRSLLEPFGLRIHSSADFDLDEPEETEDSFAGNARLKAHFAHKMTGLPALSDDSGLEVDALNGSPGVYTADWAETGSGRDFGLAMEKVHEKLRAQGSKTPWSARFVCTLCLVEADGADHLFRGEVAGQLVWPRRGDRGFGYDPMFQADGETQTFGEIDPEYKARINHRARAFAALKSDWFDG